MDGQRGTTKLFFSEIVLENRKNVKNWDVCKNYNIEGMADNK